MMLSGYELVEQLSDNFSLVKDESRNFCYGILNQKTNSIVGFKYYKIERISKEFLLGKDKGSLHVDLLTSTGTIVDHVSNGAYEFLGKVRGLSIFLRKIKGHPEKNTMLLFETYKDRVSGEIFTSKITFAKVNETLMYHGVRVFPAANNYSDSFVNRRTVIERKALNRFKNKSADVEWVILHKSRQLEI